jgi:shikimate dehydrogenase
VKAAVVGRPVAHSLSPAIWRAAFESLGLDGWEYDAVDCDAQELERLVRRGGYAGLSVTMPHKHLAARLVDRKAGRTAGAVNTIVFGEDETVGYNTDVDGVAAALASVAPGARNVVVLGAGGTAAAAVLAVQAAGGHATLVARNGAAALELKERTGGMAAFEAWPRAREVVAGADAVVNTTPQGAADELAAGWAGAPLVDVIYDPWPTALARAAEAGGHPVAGGLYVLVHQALRQIELVTGQRPDPEPLLEAGERALRAR